jgi:hypothetical protein
MNEAVDKSYRKSDFEILFKDSPEYFAVKNAKMYTEGPLVCFVCFDDDKYKETHWYPLCNIHRIKKY